MPLRIPALSRPYAITAAVAAGMIMLGAAAQTAGAQSVSNARPTPQDIALRDNLITAQESLLNTYRCQFNIDTQIVPGGCQNGRPRQLPSALSAFEGAPIPQDIALRDNLITAQESLLNTYRCQFNIDTQIVPGGCVGQTAPAPSSAASPAPAAPLKPVDVPGKVRNVRIKQGHSILKLEWDPPEGWGDVDPTDRNYLRYGGDPDSHHFLHGTLQDRHPEFYRPGDPILRYQLQYAATDERSWNQITLSVPYIILDRLEPDTGYTVQILASYIWVNDDGYYSYRGFGGSDPYYEAVAVTDGAWVAGPESKAEHARLRETIEVMVSRLEGAWPWLRHAWEHVRTERVEVWEDDGYLVGFTNLNCDTRLVQGKHWQCNTHLLGIMEGHEGDESTTVHELAHVYTPAPHIALPDDHPLLEVYAHFRDVYMPRPSSSCPREVLADVMMLLIFPSEHSLVFYKEDCTEGVDEPTAADKAAVLRLLEHHPTWLARAE